MLGPYYYYSRSKLLFFSLFYIIILVIDKICDCFSLIINKTNYGLFYNLLSGFIHGFFSNAVNLYFCWELDYKVETIIFTIFSFLKFYIKNNKKITIMTLINTITETLFFIMGMLIFNLIKNTYNIF